MTTTLGPDEVALMSGEAGYQSPKNTGTLTLTNHRLIWDRGFSMDPFGQKHWSVPVSAIRASYGQDSALTLEIEGRKIDLFIRGIAHTPFGAEEDGDAWLAQITDAILKANTR